jgi:hypothetical protein
MDFTKNKYSAPRKIKKMKIPGSILELPGKQHCQSSSKTAPIIFIFSIAMGADYSSYLKSIAIYAPTFLGYNNSVIVSSIKIAWPWSYHRYAVFTKRGVCVKIYEVINDSVPKKGTIEPRVSWSEIGS